MEFIATLSIVVGSSYSFPFQSLVGSGVYCDLLRPGGGRSVTYNIAFQSLVGSGVYCDFSYDFLLDRPRVSIPSREWSLLRRHSATLPKKSAHQVSIPSREWSLLRLLAARFMPIFF